ncbi:predicted protein [Coccidioides posadasii str. Silveira]|uniref:Predicted protein n=1 Tax=Coccidioides posadasii (strain RMSCC 757 / Silveira) TaxID=443226 RepID=E9DA25_COCPS|nr:predicted protein [Coccidioides posadasii str. Silveira]
MISPFSQSAACRRRRSWSRRASAGHGTFQCYSSNFTSVGGETRMVIGALLGSIRHYHGWTTNFILAWISKHSALRRSIAIDWTLETLLKRPLHAASYTRTTHA